MPRKERLIATIDTIAVVVSERKKALKWYREVLGFNEAFVPRSSTYTGGIGHWIELGPARPLTRIHICQLNDEAPGPVETGPTGITFLTSDIKAAYRIMKRRGVQFKYRPKKMDWGEWLCEFTDPDGNEFDLKQPADPGFYGAG